MNLTKFLLARITEDEERWAFAGAPDGGDAQDALAERMLVECQTKRRIVQPWAFGRTEYDWSVGAYAEAHVEVLRMLAFTYAQHPDYDEAWRPHVHAVQEDAGHPRRSRYSWCGVPSFGRERVDAPALPSPGRWRCIWRTWRAASP